MVVGFSDSGGTQRSSAWSTRLCCAAVYSSRIIRRGLGFCIAEWLGLHLARAAHQDLHARFRLLQLFAAGFAELYAALEKFECAFQGKFAALHLLHDGFQGLETGFKTQWRLVRHRYIIGRALACDVEMSRRFTTPPRALPR